MPLQFPPFGNHLAAKRVCVRSWDRHRCPLGLRAFKQAQTCWPLRDSQRERVKSAEQARRLAPARSFSQYFHATRRSALGKAASVVARWNKLFSAL